MAIKSLLRALLVVGLLACLAASTASPAASAAPIASPAPAASADPELLDQNYNIPYSPKDYDREALDRVRQKVAPEPTHSPSKPHSEEFVQPYTSCCNCGRKHVPPTKREHNSCGCSSGRKHAPPTKRTNSTNSGLYLSDCRSPAKRQTDVKIYSCGGEGTGTRNHVEKRRNHSECGRSLPTAAPLPPSSPSSPSSFSSSSYPPVPLYPTYPGSDLMVPAAELEVLKQWAAEGKHPEITAEMSKHPLAKRLPPSFDSFEDVQKHREGVKQHKQDLLREKAMQENRAAYEQKRIAAISDVAVRLERTRMADEDGELPVILKITITNNSKWKIAFCEKTSPISTNAYKMGFFEVISRKLHTNISGASDSSIANAQPSWKECSRDLYSGESVSTWITFPSPDTLDSPKIEALENGGKFDVRLTGVWHGIQALGDPEVDPRWDTNQWSTYAHPFSSNTITIDM
ncbi:hypothetical protein ACHAP5_005506 [Fusarium lateritium]